jgi:hypothetical protein
MNLQNVPGFLDRGELLIWSGRPTPLGYALKRIGFQWFFGLFFFGFSLFWISMAGTASQKTGSFPGNVFWMFGIPFVLVAASMVLSPAWYYLKAGRTQFVLTDRRAVIDTRGFMGKRVSIPMGQIRFVELVEGANGNGDVIFSEQVSKAPEHYTTKRDGFLAIANAAEVERKLRGLIEARNREVTKPA